MRTRPRRKSHVPEEGRRGRRFSSGADRRLGEEMTSYNNVYSAQPPTRSRNAAERASTALEAPAGKALCGTYLLEARLYIRPRPNVYFQPETCDDPPPGVFDGGIWERRARGSGMIMKLTSPRDVFVRRHRPQKIHFCSLFAARARTGPSRSSAASKAGHGSGSARPPYGSRVCAGRPRQPRSCVEKCRVRAKKAWVYEICRGTAHHGAGMERR